ncbi:glycosyltransferase family 1 protein [Gloeocapsa sp. PCC 73106]|uniref:glycosyltransferase family 4 protein n=1 Tax=Gloeocapsa sp. PCC 73106 TaxID=102232 RepID=UPI0002ABDFE1|nr:glycosyltransferase family 1 protein [Gloeocapsa sp. PCC 73106]ELR99524.1 glycosyltransferase [Gloeocapsa sp. PCC 73106]
MSQGKLLINLAVLLPQPTGISNYALNIIPYLQQLEPKLLVAKPQSGYDCHLIPENLSPAQGTLGHLRRIIWTQWQLPRIYAQEKASLLFSPVPEAPIGEKLRYLVMVHDLIPLRFPRLTSPLTPYFRYYLPRVLEGAEHIICNSQATAQDIAEFIKIPPEKITAIHLGYDTEHFTPRENLPSPSVPYFLYLGRHDPHKNLSRLLTALGTIAPDCTQELWLVGPTDKRYTPQLQQQAIALNIANRVKFLNYLPYSELPIVINQATAVVYPSLWEGFGFPVLEAMACGTPVITSNLASLPEITGNAAILIDPYQIESIAAAMKLLSKNHEERSRYRQLGLTQARHFSWAKTGEATAQVLARYV